MKPVVFYTCKNESCEKFKARTVVELPEIHISHNRCPLCLSDYGKLEIIQGNKEFTNTAGLVEYLKGLQAQYRILKKFVDKGVADGDDLSAFENIKIILREAFCPCCGAEHSIPEED